MKGNKKPSKATLESGITLIALIVIIVILIILSSIIIKGMTGNHSLIDQTQVAAEDYKIKGYGEQIDQNVRSTILAYATMGEEPSLQDIADGLKEETEWIKSATACEDEELGGGYILAATYEGYEYQVLYDPDYGTVDVEYLGKYPGRTEDLSLPSLKARYERNLALIYAEAKHEEGIAKIELIYKQEIKDTSNTPTGQVEFDASALGTGWYKVKATANNGMYIYKKVRVTNISDKLVTPIITYNPIDPDGVNGVKDASGKPKWYINPVTVTISTESVAAKEVHYILTGANQAGGEDGVVVPLTADENGVKSISFVIGEGSYSTSGETEIIAWTQDEKGLKCKDDAIGEVKFDNVKPQITSNVVNATKGKDREGKETGWIVSKGTIDLTATDAVANTHGQGALNGYYYEVTDSENNVLEPSKYVADIKTRSKDRRKRRNIQSKSTSSRQSRKFKYSKYSNKHTKRHSKTNGRRTKNKRKHKNK